jgi:hypothetical protein
MARVCAPLVYDLFMESVRATGGKIEGRSDRETRKKT